MARATKPLTVIAVAELEIVYEIEVPEGLDLDDYEGDYERAEKIARQWIADNFHDPSEVNPDAEVNVGKWEFTDIS